MVAASRLLASAYSTPARRAFGSLGRLPDDFEFGGIGWGGLNVAELLVSSSPFL